MMEEKKKKDWLTIISNITLLVATVIPLYFLFVISPKQITTQVLVIFGIIIGTIFFTIFLIWVRDKYKKMINDIENNKKELEEIKKDLNFKELFNKMDIRLSVIEELMKNQKRGKRGQVDPRWIAIIILIILLILFLRQVGFLGR